LTALAALPEIVLALFRAVFGLLVLLGRLLLIHRRPPLAQINESGLAAFRRRRHIIHVYQMFMSIA